MSNTESYSVSDCCACDNCMKLPGGNSSEFAKCLLVLAGSSLLFAAQADTVAWWHFDEAEPGTKAGAVAITDSVSGAVAVPEIIENTTVHTAETSEYDGASYAPAYARPFVGRKVVDPVSGETHTNRSAMKFTTASGGSQSWGAYYAGSLKVSNTQSLLANCKSQVTIEAFVCTTGGLNCAQNFAPIIASLDGTSWTGERWALYLDTESKGLGRFAFRINTEKGVVKWQGNAPATKFNDGAWHHLAYVYDGTTSSPCVKLYIDYTLLATFTDANILASIPYGANNNIYIGGYENAVTSGGVVQGYRRFPGLIDEVRISSEALEPAQFLQMHPADEIEDELLRISFDPGEYGTMFDGKNMSDTLAPSDDYQRALLKTGKAGGEVLAEYDESDKPAATMASGLFSDEAENTASLCVTTNGSAKGYYIQASSFSPRLIGGSSTNYTVECFFKTAGQVRGPTSNRQTLFQWGSDKVFAKAVLCAETSTGSMDTGDLLFVCRNSAGTHQYVSTVDLGGVESDDGTWHHLAIVVDSDRKELRAYFDYELVAIKTSFVPGVTGGYSLFVGSGYDNKAGEPNQYFDGRLDDLRVTKRALRPEEFQTTHSVGRCAQATPLLTALLEQNYEFVCATNSHWSITGSGTARTEDGAAPEFEKVSRGTLFLDGTNGTVSAANVWSAKMAKSNIVFPASRLYELDEYTVEFWAKLDGIVDGTTELPAGSTEKTSGHVGVLRFVQGDTTDFDWYLYRHKDNARFFQMAVRAPNGGVPTETNYFQFDLGRVVVDGKWHHYAISVARNADNSEASFTLYADYELVGTHTVAGLYDRKMSHRLMFFESTADDKNILGNIDAVRFWRGTPDPSQFFGRKKGGMVLVLK